MFADEILEQKAVNSTKPTRCEWEPKFKVIYVPLEITERYRH